MTGWSQPLLDGLAGVNPAPLFALSLIPYLAFLWWARQIRGMPPLAWRGFAFTLVFVAGTVVGSILAGSLHGERLADVDPLHGSAEVLLTVSNVMVLLGFQGAIIRLRTQRAAAARREDG
jgi:hypothetical protein